MKIVTFVFGMLVGVAATAVAAFKLLPKLMLQIHDSQLGFDETVTAVEQAAKSRNWKVPKIYDIQKTLQEAGHDDMTRLKILSICQPHHAYHVLQDDADKVVTAIMPCRVAVYEDSQGRVKVAEMNMSLMSQFFSPKIRDIMGSQVAVEEKAMLEGIVQPRPAAARLAR